jgi:hypothetical protein
MFALTDQQVFIRNFSARKEIHGDITKLAGTLTCEVTCNNAVLDEFDPGLRALLYRKPDAGEHVQGELPIEQTDGLTARRLPHVKPQVWEEDFPGYTASFPSGIKVKDEISLAKLKLSKLVFEALDGGSVRITFSLAIPAPMEWMTAGKLDFLIQEMVQMTLTPPGDSKPDQADLAA